MKTKTQLPKQAAIVTAIILGSTAWLSAQTSSGTSGQTTPGGTGRYNDQTRQPGAATTYDPSTSGQGRQPGAATTTTDSSYSSEGSQIMKINRGSNLIGATVKNQQGETLGKIKDIVVDFNTEKVAYAVLDAGTGLLSSQKLHAVPLRAFQPDADGKSLILNADKEKLSQAQGFERNNWPAMNSSAWGGEPFWRDNTGTTTTPGTTVTPGTTTTPGTPAYPQGGTVPQNQGSTKVPQPQKGEPQP